MLSLITRAALLVFTLVVAACSGTPIAQASPTGQASVLPSATAIATSVPAVASTVATSAPPSSSPTPNPFAFEISGLLVDKSGAPIPGGSVRLYRASAGCAQFGTTGQIGAQATSGSDGTFSLRVPAALADVQGQYILYAQASGHFVFFDQRANCDSGITLVSSTTANRNAVRVIVP